MYFKIQGTCMIQEIDVKVLNDKFLSKDDFILLDVRTEQEVFTSRIASRVVDELTLHRRV